MVRSHRQLAVAAGACVCALGLLVLIGWHARVATLVQLLPSFVPMQYNTALGFVGCGLGVVLSSLGWSRLGACCGALAAALGLATLFQYATGADLGLDELLMEHYVTTRTTHPGRMAPNTALAFGLAGGVLLLDAGFRPDGRLPALRMVMVAAAFALGSIAAFGYAIGLDTAIGWGSLTGMALHTALGFMVLCAGQAVLVDRTREAGSGWRWAPLAVGSGGLVFTVLFSMALHENGRQKLAAGFEVAAEARIRTLERELDHALGAVYGLATFWEVAPEVDPDRMREFAARLMTRHPILALEWLPRVQHDRRAAFEAEMSRELGRPATITELDPQGRLVPAPQREAYFPVRIAVPEDGNRLALGFDHASQQIRRNAMERAAEAQGLAASGTIPLFRASGDADERLGMLVFAAVGPAGDPWGFVGGVVHVAQVLGQTDDAAQDPLVSLELRLAGSAASPSAQRDRAEGGLSHARTLDLAGSPLTIRATATEAYRARHRSLESAAGFAGSLAVTGALCACVVALSRRREEIERTVAERTSQLRAANEDLRREIEERERMERALAERTRTLEGFNVLAVGRELRMVELKREVNRLAEAGGGDPVYDLAFAESRRGGGSRAG